MQFVIGITFPTNSWIVASPDDESLTKWGALFLLAINGVMGSL